MRWLIGVVLCVPLMVQAVSSQEMAPDFTLKSLEGSNLRLDEYKGQVVLINFWATWCGPCRQELPLLDRIHRRYQDAGFAVLGINVEGVDKTDEARAMISKAGVTFPVLVDEGQKISELYALEAMPTSVVVDRDGVVRYVHLGYKPGDEAKYVDKLKKLLRR